VRYPEDFDDLIVSSAADFARLPARVQVGYCIHQLEAQMNDGGFYQFFANASGEYTRETLQALAAIGAHRTRALLEKAIAIAYPEGYPGDAAGHQDALADYGGVSAALHPVDSAFWRYDEPLPELVNGYLVRTR
jgi:hypothetical protein